MWSWTAPFVFSINENDEQDTGYRDNSQTRSQNGRKVSYKLITILLAIVLSIPPQASALAEIVTTGILPSAFDSGLHSTLPPGAMSKLAQAGVLGANGQPNGLLIDTRALQSVQSPAQKPEAMVNSLSISRIQSAYVPGQASSNTLTITFTVTNNRSPAGFSSGNSNATITETLAALQAMDLTRDPNVIRNVLVTDSFLPANATFVSASPAPDRKGANLAWNLADEHFYDSRRVVDWYHATEHLAHAADALHGEDSSPVKQRWLKEHKQMLFEGQALHLAQTLQALATGQTGGAREALLEQATYFEHNQHRMNYLELREEGWLIGSGMVESGAKQFKHRFTGPGMRWSRPGAERLLPIRAAVMSHTFDDAWRAIYKSPNN
jgi:hypothetical protein